MPDRQVALVTGASRGIGRGIALALAGRGWAVAVNYHRSVEAAGEVVRLAGEAGGEGMAVQADIGCAEDRSRLLDETLNRYARLDLLVNNAGMAPRVRSDLLETTEASYDEVMDTNLKGPFFLTQLVARKMVELVKAGQVARPNIVNIGSINAYTSAPNRGEYCVSKAGMAMITKLFADRLAEYGINVYEVRPGITDTDMTSTVREKYERLIFEQGLMPIRRWGQPEDVALAVVAIAEGSFPFSTGEVINVDGGFHLHRL